MKAHPAKENGDPLGTFLSLIDWKQAQESSHRIDSLLENDLQRLTVSQEKIIRQERLQAASAMASSLAHEINNLLAPIVGNSDFLLTHPEALNDPQVALQCISEIKAAAKDAAAIVNRLRRFYNHKEKNEHFEPLDLSPLLEQAVLLAQPQWKSKTGQNGAEIRIRMDLEDDLPVLGSEVEMRELFVNLLVNATDAMAQGGTISVRAGMLGEGVVMVEIADTGAGMSPKVSARCFEPYFTTKGERGTGLGLAIVYGIVQRHKGTIDVDSRIGHGTCFTITFPAQSRRVRT